MHRGLSFELTCAFVAAGVICLLLAQPLLAVTFFFFAALRGLTRLEPTRLQLRKPRLMAAMALWFTGDAVLLAGVVRSDWLLWLCGAAVVLLVHGAVWHLTGTTANAPGRPSDRF
jgi:hypothetical protein